MLAPFTCLVETQTLLAIIMLCDSLLDAKCRIEDIASAWTRRLSFVLLCYHDYWVGCHCPPGSCQTLPFELVSFAMSVSWADT